MTEIYSSTERLIIILVIYACSLAISLIYLCPRVDFKKASLIIIVLCVLYASLFVFLNVIAVFDLFVGGLEGFNELMKIIGYFYLVFTIVDKALGFVLFNVLIYYLESGHYSIYKKLLDYFIRTYNGIKKMGICQFIIILAIGIPIVSGLLTFLIINRDQYGLESPLDYIGVILDCYAVFEIYTSVGFFSIQVIKDYKRERDVILVKRYYRYTITKIIEKTEKYLNKIKKAYETLNKAAPTFEKDNSPYNNYLKEQCKIIKEKIDFYEKEGNNACNNNNNNNNYTIYNNNTNYYVYNTNSNMYNNNTIYNNSNYVIYNNNNNYNNYYNNNNNCIIYNNNNSNFNTIMNVKQNMEGIEHLPNEINSKEELDKKADDKEVQIENIETNGKEEEKEKEKEKEEDFPTCIRKYKKAVRRIYKLAKLYKEAKKDLYTPIKKNCTVRYVILFIAFSMVIITDFLLPIAYDFEEERYKNRGEYQKENDMTTLIIGIIFFVIISVICCAYTVITIYSTARRRYITGDFLYDKEINDNITLMKTLQLVCGYSFALVYCNLYFWKAIDKSGGLGKPKFYEKIIIPDYILKQGISVYMIVKIVVILASIIASLKFSSLFVFKNDLAEYNLSGDGCKYDNENEFNSFLEEKKKINNILDQKLFH